ncbi:MAG: phospholipase D family protein [Verrucomicrobia bacterium]|nr:phospholipase D family protein [Verrucomicrobiota bacterium]MBU1908593.1 phospholipase D family protein [Verrucomicrobiota bacterium]
MRKPLPVLCLLLAATALAQDKIHLRDGQVLEGRVLSEPRGAYLFQPATPGTPVRQIPPQAVMFVLYEDSARAAQVLGIQQARRHTEAELTPVQVLPTRAFGQAILEAARQAQTSIWITAYYLSGSQTSPIRDFYEVLQVKAKQGVEVILIAEQGAGTSSHIKEASYNFAQELARSGIQVRYSRERRVLHKKLIIVDGRLAFVGSSNLTLSGTLQGYESNVQVTEPGFVQAVVADFRRLLARSQTDIAKP